MADPLFPTIDPGLGSSTASGLTMGGTAADNLGIPSVDSAVEGGAGGGFNLQSLLGGLGTLGTLGTSLYDLFGQGGSSLTGLTQAAATAADPFSSQRGQYQSMLQGLMTDPSKFMLSPSAQSQMQLGSENLARQQAAQGFLGSGNILGALQKYGQQVASQDYFQQLNELNLLSGAQTGSPAAAGTALASLYGNRQNALANIGGVLGSGQTAGNLGSLGGALTSGLGGIGSYLSQLFGGASGGGDYAVDPTQLTNIQENLFGDVGSDFGTTVSDIGSSIDTSFDDVLAYG